MTQEKKTKKKINSRAKGATYERKIAKILTEFWGEQFSKVPASGGLRWGKDNRVVGDIVTPHGEGTTSFPFVIECKKREGWNFEQILKNTGEVRSWWEQVTNDCFRIENEKQPMLIFSKNLSPNYLMLLSDDWNKLGLEGVRTFETSLTVEVDGNERTDQVTIGFLDNFLDLSKDNIVKLFI